LNAGLERWFRRGVVAAATALLATVAIVRQGEEVARGNLLPMFDSYEVVLVRVLGVELYVDASAGVTDVLTAAALAVTAAILLHGARRLDAAARQAFNTAGWGALFLAADDLLSAHETIGHNLPALARLPLVDHPDDVVLAAYAAVVVAFAWRHRALLDGADRRPWALAGAAATVAVAHDVSPLHLGPLEEALEVVAAGALVLGVAGVARRHAAERPTVDAVGAVTTRARAHTRR
jgi:hypothetical protein